MLTRNPNPGSQSPHNHTRHRSAAIANAKVYTSRHNSHTVTHTLSRSFHNMRLLTHNMLASNVKGTVNGFPLKIEVLVKAGP